MTRYYDPSFFFFLLIASVLVLFSLFPLKDAKAAEFKLIPSLGVREEYNDNLFYTNKDKVSDFITTVSPGLELVSRTEKVDFSLLGRADGIWYVDTEELDNIDQNYAGRLRYSPTPKWTLSAGGGYTEDSRPDRDLEVTGLVTKPVIRRRQNYSGGIDHIFSEKTKAGLTYIFTREDYTEPGFADLNAHDAAFNLIRDLSQTLPNVVGRMNLAYSRYEYDVGTIDYFYGTIGFNWALDEKWSILLDGGGSYTLSETGPDENIQRDRGAGWVGAGTLSYKGEKTSGDLIASYRKAPAYGSVGVTDRVSASFRIARRFTYEFSGSLSGGYFYNKAEEGKFSTVAFDQQTFYVNPRLRYDFTRDVALEASYNFTYTRYNLTKTEAWRSLAMLRFYIQHAFFE